MYAIESLSLKRPSFLKRGFIFLHKDYGIIKSSVDFIAYSLMDISYNNTNYKVARTPFI